MTEQTSTAIQPIVTCYENLEVLQSMLSSTHSSRREFSESYVSVSVILYMHIGGRAKFSIPHH
jgi:hypothetical protein